MKKNMPLEGLRWSRDSGSALYDTPQTAVLGRAGGWIKHPHFKFASLFSIEYWSLFYWTCHICSS